MENFDFYAPTYFAFGKDKETEAGQLVKQFGGSKVLIHFGGGSVVRSGLLDRVKKSLEAEGIAYCELGGVMPNPRSGLVYEGIELCKKENVDFILAVGGGSTIDSSKAIAAGVVYEGDFWDFYEGKRIEKALPIGTVLTIAAAGSEGSPDTVITKEEGMLKRGASGNAVRPKFSILNPALTQTLPAYQSACGITDIIAHLYERYLTNTPEVEVTDRLIEALIMTMVYEGPRVIENPDNYEARANIMWAGMVSHNEIMGVGRQQDWTSHHLEHVMSALFNCAHGAGMAVIMPAWMSYCIEHGDVPRFVQLAVRVFGCDMDYNDPKRTARQGVERFKAFLREIGMPLTFQEIGADPEKIPQLVEMNHVGDGKVGQFCGGFDRQAHFDMYNLAVGK